MTGCASASVSCLTEAGGLSREALPGRPDSAVPSLQVSFNRCLPVSGGIAAEAGFCLLLLLCLSPYMQEAQCFAASRASAALRQVHRREVFCCKSSSKSKGRPLAQPLLRTVGLAANRRFVTSKGQCLHCFRLSVVVALLG